MVPTDSAASVDCLQQGLQTKIPISAGADVPKRGRNPPWPPHTNDLFTNLFLCEQIYEQFVISFCELEDCARHLFGGIFEKFGKPDTEKKGVIKYISGDGNDNGTFNSKRCRWHAVRRVSRAYVAPFDAVVYSLVLRYTDSYPNVPIT